MKKALILVPAVALMAACGGDDMDETGMTGDTLGTTTTGTYTDPAVGTMPGDTMGMGGTGMPADTMGMGTTGMPGDTMGMGTGTTPP